VGRAALAILALVVVGTSVFLWTWIDTCPNSEIALSCAVSAGQQGQHGEIVGR